MGGQALGQLVPHDVVRAVAAGAFVVMGVLMARVALSTKRDGRSLEACRNPADHGAGCEDGCWSWRVFGSTLALLFVAELGDKTQLSVLSLAGQYGSARAVFLGGALALTAVTALGVLGGEALCRLVPQRTMLWASAAAFTVIGALMASGAL